LESGQRVRNGGFSPIAILCPMCDKLSKVHVGRGMEERKRKKERERTGRIEKERGRKEGRTERERERENTKKYYVKITKF